MLEEPELAALGMRTLLAVGQGSESPSKVVVMQWKGGGDAAPLALVGKGVVFDTGGISIKPAPGMEEMTMDMGGAGVVSGVMRTLALRKAPANVVGLVGLVENMPDGKAQRPGDVVHSMKGDTIEVINTDAEGRLVLADVLWYAQDRFKPAAIVDLATLTGAIVIALGHEMAGVFSNDDALAGAFLAAAAAEGEGAWRMPLAPAYDKLLKSRIADVANVGGRPAGSVTAAQFLQRFVQGGHALGAPRHRRRRLRHQGRRARAEGRDRLGGARARPAGAGPLRGLTGDGRRCASTSSAPRRSRRTCRRCSSGRSSAAGGSCVRCGSEAGMAMLDTALWTFRDDAFLPHGTAPTGTPRRSRSI